MIYDLKIMHQVGIVYGMECKIHVHYHKAKPYIGIRVRYLGEERKEKTKVSIFAMSYNVCEKLYQVFEQANVFSLCVIDYWIDCDVMFRGEEILMIGRKGKFLDRQGIYHQRSEWEQTNNTKE